MDFTREAPYEGFANRAEVSVSPVCPTLISQSVGLVTREPFVDLP